MRRKLFITALLFVICVLPMGMLTSIPKTDREYVPEQSVLARSWREGTWVHIRNVRSFEYGAGGAVRERYVERSYDLAEVKGVWFGLSPFAEWQGPAHAFLSFEFEDGRYLTVSVEARKEQGESYSPVRGLLRRYELMYVIGEEQDVIGLRTQVWGDPVYLYPGRASPAQARRLLVAVLQRAEDLRRRPEYYNTLTNNCATNLADAINEIAPRRLRWSHALVLPGYSDEFAYEQGLLAIEDAPARVRERYRINDRARDAWGTPSFSRAIRAPLAARTP